jgi:hypothetical protein
MRNACAGDAGTGEFPINNSGLAYFPSTTDGSQSVSAGM